MNSPINRWKNFIYGGTILIILIPISSLFIEAAYDLIMDKKINHLFEGLTQIALIEIATFGFTAIILKKGGSWRVTGTIVSIFVLFACLISYAVIETHKKDKTFQHAKNVIYSIEIKPNMIPKNVLLDLAEILISEDYIPDSLTNRISGNYRKERRELMCKIINIIKDENTPPLREDFFLLQDKEEIIFWNRLYRTICFFVSAFFGLFLFVYVYYLLRYESDN